MKPHFCLTFPLFIPAHFIHRVCVYPEHAITEYNTQYPGVDRNFIPHAFSLLMFFSHVLPTWLSRGSSVNIVSGYGLDDRAVEVRSAAEARDFFLWPLSRPALGPTQLPVQWVPGVKRGGGVTLTTHPHSVPRLWVSRSYTFYPSCISIGVLWDCFTFYPLDSFC
jgi:hypothetical protein